MPLSLLGCRIQLILMLNFFTVTIPLLASVTTTATLPFQNYKMQGPPPPIQYSIIKEFDLVNSEKTAIRKVATEETKEKRLICKGCNTYESLALDFLQNKGIKDKNALATIMGNIRQESTFVPNICEGGSRTSYSGCSSGGYGLIQWTDSTRYYGLGRHAAKIGANPSNIETQLDYMINESDWKMIEGQMKVPGRTINDYMRLAQKWIRWGHHGARTDYAYNYASKLVFSET